METIFKHKWQADCNCPCWEKYKAQGIRKQIYSLSQTHIYTHTQRVKSHTGNYGQQTDWISKASHSQLTTQ